MLLREGRSPENGGNTACKKRAVERLSDAFTGVSGHRFGRSNYGRSASNGPPVFVTGYVFVVFVRLILIRLTRPYPPN